MLEMLFSRKYDDIDMMSFYVAITLFINEPLMGIENILIVCNMT